MLISFKWASTRSCPNWTKPCLHVLKSTGVDVPSQPIRASYFPSGCLLMSLTAGRQLARAGKHAWLNGLVRFDEKFNFALSWVSQELRLALSELKIDLGPGYRVYYTQRGQRLLLLLIGGDKSTQQKDIEMAILLARNFKE